MRTSDHIIALLYDHPRRLWGRTALATAAEIDAASLSAALDELRRRGHPIQTSPDGAIHLAGPAAMDAHLIERDLPVRRVGRNAICFAELDSTNDTAADSSRQADSDGLVVTAELQRKGRGRHGRRWVSPVGANILASVVLHDRNESLPPEAVTVAAGLSVAEAIDEVLGGRRPASRLKWPNDVLLDGCKAAGVLLERRHGVDGRVLVIGVGINVNAYPPDGAVDRPATSLAEHAGRPVDRIATLRALLLALDGWIDALAHDRGQAVMSLRRQWGRRCGMLNERHTIRDGGRRFTGRVVDIDPLAGLVLLTDGGTQVHIPAEGASVE